LHGVQVSCSCTRGTAAVGDSRQVVYVSKLQ
jgi:hypothetical protein